MPLLVIIACILLALASMIGVGVHALRHHRGVSWAWLCLPLGGVLALALIPASIGLAERSWSPASTPFLLCLLAGLAGLALQIRGWIAIARPPLSRLHCPHCGYLVDALPTCPECGRPDRR